MSRQETRNRINNEIWLATANDSITPEVVGSILTDIVDLLPKTYLANVKISNDGNLTPTITVLQNDFAGAISIANIFNNDGDGGFEIINSFPEFTSGKLEVYAQSLSARNLTSSIYRGTNSKVYCEFMLGKIQNNSGMFIAPVVYEFQIKINVFGPFFF